MSLRITDAARGDQAQNLCFYTGGKCKGFSAAGLFLFAPLPESSCSTQMPPNQGESHTKGALLSVVLSEWNSLSLHANEGLQAAATA